MPILLDPFYEDKQAQASTLIKINDIAPKQNVTINENKEIKKAISQDIDSEISHIGENKKEKVVENDVIQNGASQSTSNISDANREKEQPKDDGFNDLADLFGGFIVS